jgi:hypothetical protein
MTVTDIELSRIARSLERSARALGHDVQFVSYPDCPIKRPTSASTSCGHPVAGALGRFVPILLQKSR